MKIIRNLGDRYRLLDGREAVALIDKALKECSYGNGLEEWQKKNLISSFGNRGIRGNLGMPFLAYAWEEEKVSGTFVWRLTYPFFLIYGIFMHLTILPIKWVFTGKHYLSETSRLGRFNVNWYNKITNRHW